MLDTVLIENANTLIQWQKRAYLAEARVKEITEQLNAATLPEKAVEHGDE